MTRKKKVPQKSAKRRPYRAPALKTYGDLKALTSMKGGNRADAPSPKSKTTGSV